MPELPEVEVTRLSFADRIAGAQHCGRAPGQAPALAAGLRRRSDWSASTVLAVRRRGKYLLLDWSDGLLLVHLGMSGSLSFGVRLAQRAGKHDHFDMRDQPGHLAPE